MSDKRAAPPLEPIGDRRLKSLMKKASEYRLHAEECRQLAAAMDSGDQRDQLLEMAANWEKMAQDRSDLVHRHPELAMAGEQEEETGRKP